MVRKEGLSPKEQNIVPNEPIQIGGINLAQTRKVRGYWQDPGNVKHELEEAITQLGHFPTHTDLRIMNRSTLGAAMKPKGVTYWKDQLGVPQNIKPTGYWEDKENIRNHLTSLMHELGHFPTQIELKLHGLSSIGRGIRKTGGFLFWMEALGIHSGRKEMGYWSDEQNIQAAILDVIQEINRFPQEPDLESRGLSSLKNAIATSGGFTVWRKRLGYFKPEREPGYWRNVEHVREAITQFISESGMFPTYGALRKNGQGGLAEAMAKSGGMRYWREKLGFVQSRKEKGYWRNEENIRKALREWKDIHGHFPTQAELIKTGPTGLSRAISLSGGLLWWRRDFGEVQLHAPKGYWNRDTIREHIQNWINQYGEFPTDRKLTEAGNFPLINAITKNGGFTFWKHEFGIKPIRRESGYWDTLTIRQGLEEFISLHRHFPTVKELQQTRNFALERAISRNHGIAYWRREFGEQLLHNAKGYWDEIHIRDALQQWINKFGHFPTNNDLKKTDSLNLGSAIVKHGGYSHWKKQFGLELERKEQGYWDNRENIRNELAQAIAAIGHFPTQRELSLNGFGRLTGPITRSGGIDYWKKELRYEVISKPVGYFHDPANIREELGKITNELGQFPNIKDLSKYAFGLRAGMQRTGGMNFWRAEMGYPQKTTPSPQTYFTVERIEEMLQIIISQKGYFPLHNELRAINNGLVTAITKTGGIFYWREKFGQTLIQHPQGYYTSNPENVRRELKEMIEQLGHFPKRNDFGKGNSGLRGGMEATGGWSFWRGQFEEKKNPQPTIQLSDYLEVEDE